MASLTVTTTPQPITILCGSPVHFSSACLIGITSTDANSGSGVSIATGDWTWPGVFDNQSVMTLYVCTASGTATLTYLLSPTVPH